MMQKPFAVTVRAGQLLLEAAQRRNLTVGVMENVRYAAGSRFARWVLERGEIGRVQMVAAVSLGTLEWSPDKVVADTPWRHRRVEAGGGASLDIGVHLAHRLRYVVGEVEAMMAVARTFEPERVRRDASDTIIERVAADADDAFFALPQFANGAVGTVSFTWAGHGPSVALPGGMVIYGDRGSLHGQTLVRDDGTREELPDLFEREADVATREHFFPHGLTDTFALCQLDWMRAIRAGDQPEMDGTEGLRDLATAYAMLESSVAGRAVSVEDVLAGRVRAYQEGIDEFYGF
jgi:predicted dehydrogenase